MSLQNTLKAPPKRIDSRTPNGIGFSLSRESQTHHIAWREIMSKVAVLMAVVLVAFVSLAQGEETKEKGKTHDITTEVIAVDVEGKTITIKGEADEEITVPVMEEAVAGLGEIKKGDKVTVTCMDDENGQHTGIAKIKPAEA